MAKVVLGLVTVAVLLSALFLIHGIASGLAPPYPDPTPEQAASARYHQSISTPLFLAAGVAWLATGVAVTAFLARQLIRGGTR